MHSFESHVLHHSHDIFTLLSSQQSNYNQGLIPLEIRHNWSMLLYLKSKSIKIKSLQNIINHNTFIQTNLFDSKFEYNQYSSFIQNDLIPIIIDYEMNKNNIISEIENSMKQKINNHISNTKNSIFTKLGWIELILFIISNICSFTSRSYLQTFFCLILLICYLFHLFYGIKTFQQRRTICYYLNCLSEHKNVNNHNINYTAYILEGFNICNPSLLSSHKTFRLYSCNKIDSFIAIISSLKYIFGIIYCIASITNYFAVFIIIQLPLIFGSAMNWDYLFAEFNKEKYKYLKVQYNQILRGDVKGNQMQKFHSNGNCFRMLTQLLIPLSFYSVISLCSVLFVSSLSVGLGIMCDVKFEITDDCWTCAFKDWTMFMSAKISFAVPIIFIIDYFQYDSGALDIENGLFFISLGSITNVVLISLWFGINSWITNCFVIVAWTVLYVYLTICTVKYITHDLVTLIKWTDLFGLKWINSNLFQMLK
eukprot:521896_1